MADNLLGSRLYVERASVYTSSLTGVAETCLLHTGVYIYKIHLDKT